MSLNRELKSPAMSGLLAEIRRRHEALEPKLAVATGPRFQALVGRRPERNAGADLRWPLGEWLQGQGVLPEYVARIREDLSVEKIASSLEADLADLARHLQASWRSPAPFSERQMHLFVGPAGAGKTTVLCKWLAQAVLVREQSASVLRLDGQTANHAEFLNVFAEALHVPVHRRTAEVSAANIRFIDLPGFDPSERSAFEELQTALGASADISVHIVLNGAYEATLLLDWAKRFDAVMREAKNFPVSSRDVIITHLDEEKRWGKMLNLVYGTELPLSYLSAGQNVPGMFLPASPAQLLNSAAA